MSYALDFREKRDWIRLARTTTVGPVAFQGLLKRYKTAGQALEALPALVARTGRKTKLKIPPVEQIEAEMAAVEDFGARMIANIEPDFPALLRAVDPVPPLICVKGDFEVFKKPAVALVGSRNASAIGLQFARQLATDLGAAGFAVISGLARGIDAQAHMGSIEAGTAAVLGGGIDHIYPRENEDLYHEIAQTGILVSESPIGYRATARDFPRRNRIISGLSLGVVVIEAAERSGTLITARCALEQNREVMAAPGSPLDPRTKGCNRLIRQGAALIENAQDVLDVLENTRTAQMSEDSNDYVPPDIDWKEIDRQVDTAREHIRALCSPTPTARDVIIRQSGYPYAIAIGALLELELSGQILVETDGRISLSLGAQVE